MKRTKETVEIPADVQWQRPHTLVEASPAAAKRNTGEKAVVTFVEDGDTASLKRQDGSSINCRIDKIDAPEVGHPKVGKKEQPFGEESKQTLRSMIENKEVTLRITRPQADKYGRNLCQIEVEGKDVSAEMVRKGAAWLYREYGNDPTLMKEEAMARRNRTGLWGAPIPEYPPAFRRRNPGDK